MRRSLVDDRLAGMADEEVAELAVADDAAAIAELYRRYFRFARTLAQLSDRSAVDPAALIAEAFRRAFDALRSAGQPRPEFRGVLSAAILAVAGAGADRPGAVTVPAPRTAGTERSESDDRRGDRHTRLRWVLARMPLQERRDLWQDQVESGRPARGGRDADTPATRRFRYAYLADYLEERLDDRGRVDRYSRLLVECVLDSVSGGSARRLRNHLAGCPDCSELLADLRCEDTSFRSFDLARDLLDLAPFVLAGSR